MSLKIPATSRDRKILRARLHKIVSRCYRHEDKDYHRYGGRGICVCDSWLADPQSFVDWALSAGFSKELQIDRIDNFGPYSPGNCRFATAKTNSRNRRSAAMLTAFGETKSVAEWMEDGRCVSPSRSTLSARLDAGWTPENALSTPFIPSSQRGSPKAISAFGETKRVSAWLKDGRCLVGRWSLAHRLRCGWSPERAMSTPDMRGRPVKDDQGFEDNCDRRTDV